MLNGGKMDWKRVGTASLFGAIFVGPVGNFWSVGKIDLMLHVLA
jgi:hypothetical protein